MKKMTLALIVLAGPAMAHGTTNPHTHISNVSILIALGVLTGTLVLGQLFRRLKKVRT